MTTLKVEIQGIVQGVGFRPYVYNLALKYDIKGWVNNDDRGMNVLLHSNPENCDRFLKELEENPPVLSKINSIKITKIETSKNYENFEILKSKTSNNKSTIISSDIAICDDCIDDINDKSNHRHDYALTNCTNCGPRYSIIKTVPYDRVNTSMKDFNLCPTCKEEYENPTNRRYHAQPVSCSECGPNVTLYNNKNEILECDIEAIKSMASHINNGTIVAIKGMGGFHLVCDANNTKSVKELRIRKSRPAKPFAVMFKNIKSVKDYTNITKKEEEFLNSKEKPIVLVEKKDNTSLSQALSPDISKLGCFIAYTPLHHLLFKYLKNPILATSANLKDEPIIRFKDEVIEKLPFIVEYILDFNRDIINSCDDSVIQVVNNDISKLRNARGYAPTPLKLEKSLDKKILALGTNQKSTISIAFENNLILSPYIADLNSIESIEYFKRTIKTFKDFYDFEPDVIICDKHPNYESTKFAKTFKEKTILQVQHHYAHILSCMAEYNLKKEVLGFAFDGTGYGDDGNIWGGEVFVCDNKKYKRVKHLKYFKLLGGEASIKEPKRVALSLLFDSYSLEELKTLDSACVNAFKPNELVMLYTMWQKGLNSPLTSSIGRLFDAIASLANICHTQSYEGETGLLIEEEYDASLKDSYSYTIKDEEIDISSMIKQILEDKNKTIICTKFINTLVDIIIEISDDYKDLPLVLSGGVFQNKTLLELLISKLDSLNKEYYYSKNIPLNDGGISVGQIYSQL